MYTKKLTKWFILGKEVVSWTHLLSNLSPFGRIKFSPNKFMKNCHKNTFLISSACTFRIKRCSQSYIITDSNCILWSLLMSIKDHCFISSKYTLNHLVWRKSFSVHLARPKNNVLVLTSVTVEHSFVTVSASTVCMVIGTAPVKRSFETMRFCHEFEHFPKKRIVAQTVFCIFFWGLQCSCILTVLNCVCCIGQRGKQTFFDVHCVTGLKTLWPNEA